MIKVRLTAYLQLLKPYAMLSICLAAGICVQAQVPKLNSFPAARATVYLDFDGQLVKGTAWNWDGPIQAKHSGLTSAIITQIFNRVAEDYRIFNLNITTDAAVYSRAPVAKRVRIILTPTYEWYGSSGGVAFVNSFTWGDDTPAWVFTTLLHNNGKYIAEAASHEIGHTLGLQHQSTYSKTCNLLAEYAEGRGSGEIGWAPIMGVGYYKNFTTWTYGTTIEGCKTMQNDISVVSKGLNNIGLRNDDHSNLRSKATSLVINSNKFNSNGIINNSTDKDFFKIILTKKSRLKVAGMPAHVAASNSGANVDLMMTLIKNNGDTMIRANPKTLLSASFDTLLLAGTYYIGIDGIYNQNISDYGSVGFYTLTGSINTSGATTTQPIVVNGTVKENKHLITWNNTDKESNTKTYLETSFDGVHYMPVTQTPMKENHFVHEPKIPGNAYYRVRSVLPDDSYYYSNNILLSSANVSLVSNMVNTTVQVIADGNYTYLLYDELGRTLQRGNLVEGTNNVALNFNRQGMLMMKVFNHRQQFNFKLVKQ